MPNTDDYFGPKAVNDHFMKITTLKHPSRDEAHPEDGNEDEVREYVAECANKIDNIEKPIFYEPDATDAGKRVIVVRRPGSGKYSDAPYITLQAHMDMVCFPKNDIFPLKVFDYDINGEKWIKAGEKDSISDPKKGTTLGADDGIGVATALALLEDETLKEYPLECFFTVQEENDMGGAEHFDKNLLKGRKYINLDAENEATIFYGCAGGCDVSFEGTVERSDMEDDFVALKVSISGLRGGHSGVNINNGRLNAIKGITEILINLNERITNRDVGEISGYDMRLISMQRDEQIKMNSIPSSASAVVAISMDKKESFENNFAAQCNALKALYQPEEDKFSWQVSWLGDVQEKPLSKISTDALLCLLCRIPHGVIRMIPQKDNVNLVETSSNLAGIEIGNDTVAIKGSNRSANDANMKALKNVQINIGNFFDYSVKYTDGYPSWQPNEKSELLAIAKDVYRSKYPEYSATVIHAGLECSQVVAKYGSDIDCISIGPTIVDPHSGGERLKASTVEQFYDAVTQIIQRIFEKE
ncbi:MAG: M20/M25/M40 family metallo-hydrolase [Methanothrix sp.]|nr:M20/M25/M40 family metallo-hydrolase [Methanothrix sp.]